MEKKPNVKMIYEDYIIKSTRQILDVLFIKTCQKDTCEVIWFLGYIHKNEEIVSAIHRVMSAGIKVKNTVFKQMFADNLCAPTFEKIRFE